MEYCSESYWRVATKENAPPRNLYVMVYYPNKNYGSRQVVDYWEGSGFSMQFGYGQPSHWRPLFPPPEEYKENNYDLDS